MPPAAPLTPRHPPTPTPRPPGAAAESAARSQSRRGRSLVRKRGRSEAGDAEMAAEEPKKRIHSSKSRCVCVAPVLLGSLVCATAPPSPPTS